jgi:hypothetical protein
MAGLGAVKQAASGRCVVLLELLGKNMGKRARAPGEAGQNRHRFNCGPPNKTLLDL